MDMPISNAMTGAQSSLLAGQSAWKQKPETEGFDFMQYLLGLQAGSTPGQPAVGPMVEMPGQARDGANASLLALFQNKPRVETEDPLAESKAALAALQGTVAVPDATPLIDAAARATADLSSEPNDVATKGLFDPQSQGPMAPKATPTEKDKPIFELGGGPEGGPKPISVPPKQEEIVSSELTYRAPQSASEALVREAKLAPDKDKARVELSPWMSPEVKAIPTAAVVPETREAAPAMRPAELPEVFDRVRSLAQSGGGTMTVSLNPPELGKIEIQVKARGRSVEVEMRSESAHAKGVIEGGLHELRQAMHTQDLVLSKVEVSHGNLDFRMPNPGEGFRESRHDGNGQRGFMPAEKPRAIQSAAFTPARFQGTSAHTGRLDLRL